MEPEFKHSKSKIENVLRVFDELRETSSWPREERRPRYDLDSTMVPDLSLFDPENPEAAEFEGQLCAWLDDFEATHISELDSDNMDLGEQASSSTYAIAWYDAITFAGEHAGIFITDYGIALYSSRIRRWLNSVGQTTGINRAATYSALQVLLAHESFHHDVEWFAIRQSQTTGLQKLYEDYDSNVYKIQRGASNDSTLEETIASAVEYFDMAKKVHAAQLNSDQIRAVREWLKANYALRPDSYRAGNKLLKSNLLRSATYQLACMIVQGSPIPQYGAGSFKPFLITKGALNDHFRENFLIVQTGRLANQNKANPPFTFSVPNRKIEKLISRAGYAPTGRGKGSHTVWSAPGKADITLPARKDQQCPDVLKNVARALSLNGLRGLNSACEKV
ncbi:MAG: hypothetical protein RL196_298 [Actinomycetota bacterium]